MSELLFETFKVPAVYLARSSVLTSFTSGRSTGLVFEISASGASAVPVYEGFVVGNAVKRNSLGGNFLTAQYSKVLTAANIQLVPNQFIASKVSEPHCRAYERPLDDFLTRHISIRKSSAKGSNPRSSLKQSSRN